MTGGAAVLQIPRTPGVGVRFHHTDAKLADFTNAAVVWINDAVWSVATRSAVYARLAADLRLGALVVDYPDSLVPHGPLQFPRVFKSLPSRATSTFLKLELAEDA